MASHPTKNAYGLLHLPNELLHEILQLSRPDSFEALILSCKRIHAVGLCIIQDHNLCKTWYSRWTRLLPSRHVALFDTLRLFHELSISSKSQQAWVLLYLRSIHWDGEMYTIGEGVTLEENIRKIMINTPWLKKASQKNYITLENIDFEDILSDNPHDDKYEPSAIRPNDSDENLNNELPRLFPTAFYEVLPLLMMDNLESITFGRFPILNKQTRTPAIPTIITQLEGKDYFQRLHTVEVLESFRCTLNDISPFLLLPQLRRLIVGMLQHSDHERYTGPINTQSKLCQLVFYSANIRSECLRLFMSNLVSVQSLIWEDYRIGHDDFEDSVDEGERATPNLLQPSHLPTLPTITALEDKGNNEAPSFVMPENHLLKFMEEYQIEDEDEIGETLAVLVEQGKVTLDHPLIQRLCRFPTDYDSDSYVEDDFNHEVNDNGVETNQYDGWSPAKIANIIMVPHKATLKQLSLTVSPNSCFVDRKREKISNLLSFSSLTHLEIDSRILRARVCKNPNNQPSNMPPSLVDILPQSIKVIRLCDRTADIETIHGMLRKLPRHIHEFPNLREITIVYDGDLDYRPERLDVVVFKLQLELLRKELYAAGVMLKIYGVDSKWSKRSLELDL